MINSPYNPIVVRDMVSSMYKNEDGSPVSLTPTQVEIFAEISMRLHARVHCETFTRFGKSRTTALAVLTRVATFPEKWAIVAGTKDKARIIMNYVNAHIFDNEFTASRFRMEKGDSAEAIRRHRNKNHITFDVGNNLIGELFICSAKEALGFGAKNIIEDESALIDNNDHSLVMRMLGDDPNDNFLFKIGNPFNRNHFLDSRQDPAYHKILVDCYQGVHEGRINQATIEENRKYSFFPVLYECKFPRAEDVDTEGWSYLLTEDDIKKATDRWASTEKFGVKRLGNDVARGGRNFNVWCLRGDNYATFLEKSHENNLMNVAGKNIAFSQEHHVLDGNCFIDDTGVGGGVTDKMLEEGYHPVAVQLGAKATEMEMRFNPLKKKEELVPAFVNMRAQLYAGKKGVQHWVKYVGALDPEKDWSELTRIRYKKNGSGLTMIESKDDMRARGEESPDEADAFMLTFAETGAVEKKAFKPVDPKAILEQGSRMGWGGGQGSQSGGIAG